MIDSYSNPVESRTTGFPVARPRRLRRTEGLRALVRETRLTPDDFVYPLFVTHGEGIRSPIPSMPGQFRLSVDMLEREAPAIRAEGLRAVLLFGIPATKDAVGSESYAADGIVQQAVRTIKHAAPELVVVTDVCLCEYTDHGHCGLLGEIDEASSHAHVLNDETLDVLGRIARSHARAGADVVAPSGMLDGMVGAIRSALDEDGFKDTAILSYAVKYASALYGPFRDAADGAPRFGDRRSHQMDPANARVALREAALDIHEGADVLMVKPALAYLDIIYRLHEAFPERPLAAYHVSGEYAMVKAAAERGWLDERRTVLELLTGIKRAGADLIVTYHARDAARWLF